MVVTHERGAPREARHAPVRPVVDVVVPVYNEERVLETSVRRLRAHLDREIPWPSVVTIADNGSLDATPAIADRLAGTLHGVRVRHLTQKGRGLALRTAWSASEADVVAYMDVDLSTSLSALLPLLAPLVSGHSDVAIGSRLVRGARVVRGPKRELISRAYNRILRAALRNDFSDAQCGFKAVRSDVARRLLPEVADNKWFFDTELLVLAERSALRIHEVPVDWVDDPDSRVDVVRTATDDLRGVVRLLTSRRRLESPLASGRPVVAAGQRFARIGVVSTVAYLVAFFALRGALGDYAASAGALALCTTGNLFANATTTFPRRGPGRAGRLVLAGVSTWALSVGLTSVALLAVHALGVATPAVTIGALVLANAAGAGGRFLTLRAWLCARPGYVLPTKRSVP